MNEKISAEKLLHKNFMKLALKEAKKAEKILEVPIGAIIVKNGKVISSGFNKKETEKNSLKHAEIIAIEKACKSLDKWRLEDCEIYITLEPCPMCMGAIINSRIKTVIFGCEDYKSGACGSLIDFEKYNLNHKPKIIKKVLEKNCSEILKKFFKGLRYEKKK